MPGMHQGSFSRCVSRYPRWFSSSVASHTTGLIEFRHGGWFLPAETSLDGLAAAADDQIPPARALGARLLEVAGGRDLAAVDGDDDVALLHADLRGGRVFADG